MSPLATWVEQHARTTPHARAVAQRVGHGLSFQELDSRANQLANTFQAFGLTPGDRVALWLDDTPANVETYVAAAKSGLVVTPVNARLQPDEASEILALADPKAVLYADTTAARMEKCLARGALDGRQVWCTGSRLIGGARSYEADVAAGRTSRPAETAPYSPEDPVVLAFSSGTTGRAKGVELHGRGIESIVVISALARRLSYRGTTLLTSSLSFPATILASVYTSLWMGSSVVLMGQGWDVEELVDRAAEHRATFLSVLSPHVRDFAALARQRPAELRSVRSILHSGSKVAPELVEDLFDAVGDRLIEVWGMIEHSGGPVTATTVEDYDGDVRAAHDIFGSVGRPVAQVEVEVVDADAAALPHDGTTVGELIVRSPALMRGYWGDPEASASAIREGWYYSGDLGTIDAAGYVAIVDRRHDLIVSGGANVYPSEVERVILACPGVRDAVVVGVPHERWGRTPVAAVIRDTASALTEAEVIDHVRRHLAGYKKPTAVLFLDSFPRNASGKVVRDDVAAMFRG